MLDIAAHYDDKNENQIINDDMQINKSHDIHVLQHQWLLHNLPVIVQPQHDISYGNELIAVFYSFNADDTECLLSMCYASESSYNRFHPLEYNPIGTFFYRSYNQYMWHRTSDIDHCLYKGVNIYADNDMDNVMRNYNDDSDRDSWKSIYTTDHCGTQMFSQHHTRDVFHWSFCYHYNETIERHKWQRYDYSSKETNINTSTMTSKNHTNNSTNNTLDSNSSEHTTSTETLTHDKASSSSSGYRPILYLNTSNHMFSNVDLNLGIHDKHHHIIYPVLHGDRHAAENWCQEHIASKWTLQRLCKPWRWRTSHHLKQPDYWTYNTLQWDAVYE